MKISKLIPATLLVASLGAYGLANAEKGPDASPGTPAHMEHGKGWEHHNLIMELLPEDKQKILKDTMKQSFADNKPLFEQMHKLHKEREALLKANDFDQDAFLKKSAEIDALKEKLAQKHEKAIAQVASQFSPEERRVLIVMGHMMHHHGHGGHHGWHQPGEGAAQPQPDNAG